MLEELTWTVVDREWLSNDLEMSGSSITFFLTSYWEKGELVQHYLLGNVCRVPSTSQKHTVFKIYISAKALAGILRRDRKEQKGKKKKKKRKNSLCFELFSCQKIDNF